MDLKRKNYHMIFIAAMAEERPCQRKIQNYHGQSENRKGRRKGWEEKAIPRLGKLWFKIILKWLTQFGENKDY